MNSDQSEHQFGFHQSESCCQGCSRNLHRVDVAQFLFVFTPNILKTYIKVLIYDLKINIWFILHFYIEIVLPTVKFSYNFGHILFCLKFSLVQQMIFTNVTDFLWLTLQNHYWKMQFGLCSLECKNIDTPNCIFHTFIL